MGYIESLFDLQGKVAVVTGATGVLGGDMAKGLAKAGVKVGILGRRAALAEEVCAAIIQEGGEAIPLVADVLDQAALEKSKKDILSTWGKIDILVNAAGGNMPGATIAPDKSFFDVSIDAVQQVMSLNFQGTVLPTMVFASEMVLQKSGSVINISSMASQRALTRVMGYSASKAAIDNFTRWLATEFSKKYGEGVRVNAIAPGFFLGEQNRALLTQPDGSLTPRGHQIVAATPMGRFGVSEELIGALLWLAGDGSKFVTGIVVPIDGGFSAYSGV